MPRVSLSHAAAACRLRSPREPGKGGRGGGGHRRAKRKGVVEEKGEITG